MADQQPDRKQGLFQVFSSVSAAMFGVQSARNRERDFEHGKASHYIVIGLIMTVLFIMTLVGAVWIILSNVGA